MIRRVMADLIRRLLMPINPNIIAFLGLYTIVWGLWLIMPMWDVFTVAPLFNQMASIAPEWVWGTVALVSGMSISYGALKPSYRTLTVGAFIGAVHWLNVAVMYFLGDWHNTGGITSLAFCLFSAFVYLNIRLNKLDGVNHA